MQCLAPPWWRPSSRQPWPGSTSGSAGGMEGGEVGGRGINRRQQLEQAARSIKACLEVSPPGRFQVSSVSQNVFRIYLGCWGRIRRSSIHHTPYATQAHATRHMTHNKRQTSPSSAARNDSGVFESPHSPAPTAMRSDTACSWDLRPYILVTACLLRTRLLAMTFTASWCV